MVLYSVLYTSSLLVRVVFTYVFARPAAKSIFFFRCLVVCQKTIFPPGPVSACYFDSAGWAGGVGGVVNEYGTSL